MTYDWEKIFKSMSGQELYKIYTGRTLKPKEAIPFAKKELEQRGFDFDNMSVNIKTWQLMNALEDKTYDYRYLSRISLKNYILTLIGTLIIFYFIGDYGENLKFFWKDLIFPVLFFTIIAIIDNLIYKYRYRERIRRQKEIDRLKDELKLQNIRQSNKLFEGKEFFQKDFDIQQKRIKSFFRFQGILAITIAALLLLIYFYKYLKEFFVF